METFAEQGGFSAEVQEIVQALATLPTEKIREVRDYVWFLQTRYGDPGTIDTDDAWSDEDLGGCSESFVHLRVPVRVER